MAADMKALLVKAKRAKQVMEEVKQEYEDATEALIEEMRKQGVKSIDAKDRSDDVKATLVEGTRIVIIEDRLKKELGAAKWKKVTKEVLDKQKLEAHMVTGDVDPNIVAICSEEHENKPYVRMTVKAGVRPTGAPKKRSAAAKKIVGG